MEFNLLFWIIAFVTAFFSFFLRSRKSEMVLLPFLAALFFFMSGLSSYNIEKNYCYLNSTDAWTCHNDIKTDQSLGWLGYGLGSIMIVYAIIGLLGKGAESMGG